MAVRVVVGLDYNVVDGFLKSYYRMQHAVGSMTDQDLNHYLSDPFAIINGTDHLKPFFPHFMGGECSIFDIYVRHSKPNLVQVVLEVDRDCYVEVLRQYAQRGIEIGVDKHGVLTQFVYGTIRMSYALISLEDEGQLADICGEYIPDEEIASDAS
jgi:hypothetical protein